jgi:monothiol glutaredoxin
MTRPILDVAHIHPAIRSTVAEFQHEIVTEVQQAIAAHPVVVVGMKQNPYPRQARRALEAIGQPYHYLEYGSYLGSWRQRSALKFWTGWPSFPMVFVNGQLIGGAKDLKALIAQGALAALLKT